MSKRVRITAIVATLCVCLSLFVVGVLSATTATLNVTSTLRFEADGVYVMVDASLKQGTDVSSAQVLSGTEAPTGQNTFKAYSYPRMATGATPDAPNGEPSTTYFVNQSGTQVDTWAIGDINYTSTNKVVVYEFTVSNYSPFEVQGTVSGISEALATYVEQGQLTIATYTGTTSNSATATGSPTYNFTIPARTNETTPGQACYKIAVTLNNFMSDLATSTIEMNVSFKQKEPPYRIEQEVINGQTYTFVYFGKYPQTYVGDTMNATLEAWYTNQPVAETYTAYKGYSGSTLNEPVVYNAYEYIDGNTYCRVPQADLYKSGAKTFNDGTTIENGETYWFKVEPIQWRVLTENYTDTENTTPVSYLLSEYVLSANTTFNPSTSNTNHTHYSAETNALRPFLNEVFYSDAFTAEEQALIAQRTLTDADLDATKYGQTNPNDSSLTIASTEKLNVFAPSYYDMINTDYGFNSSYSNQDQQRRASATDFAMANCAYKTTSNYPDIHGLGSSYYWTSSAASATKIAYDVYYYGDVDYYYVSFEPYGARPALLFNLQS